MSIQDNKVVFDKKLKSRKGLGWLLVSAEIVLTVVLGLVIATTKILSPSAESAPGVINKLSYQGRLTDAAGDALGGTGTDYCFRFSIYDAASGGSKIWPTGTPVSSTLSVVEGVFNADIGTADTLDYNFYPTSTAYLNVEVSNSTSTCTEATLEDLAPRQQILATGYAITAENVYGDLVRTDVASSIVQIGTGAGVSSSTVKKLVLDWANTGNLIGETCTPSGAIWYNSSASNTQALVCENGKVREVAQPLLTTYSGPYINTEHLAAQIGQKTVFFQPMEVIAPFKYDRFILPIHWSNATNSSFSGTVSLYAGIYTRTGNTLSLASSSSSSFAVTASGTVGSYSLYGGKRNYPIGWTNTVYPGQYYLAIMSNTTTGGGAGMSWSNFVGSNMNSIMSGNFSQANNASNQFILGLGSYSVTSAALPASAAFSELRGSAAANLRPPVYFFMSST